MLEAEGAGKERCEHPPDPGWAQRDGSVGARPTAERGGTGGSEPRRAEPFRAVPSLAAPRRIARSARASPRGREPGVSEQPEPGSGACVCVCVCVSAFVHPELPDFKICFFRLPPSL